MNGGSRQTEQLCGTKALYASPRTSIVAALDAVYRCGRAFMRTALSTGGDLGEFLLAEFARRGINIPVVGELPQLLASWRVREGPSVEGWPKSLEISVRARTFSDMAEFCFALFTGARRTRSPHVVFDQQISTGATLMVKAQPGATDETDQNFTFDFPEGFGQFSRSKSDLTVFMHTAGVSKTTTFCVSADGKEVYISIVDHKRC